LFILCFNLFFLFASLNAGACEVTKVDCSVIEDDLNNKFSIISIINHKGSEWFSQISRVRKLSGETIYSFSLPSSEPVPNTIVLAGESYEIELACLSPSTGLKFVRKEFEIKIGQHYHVFCSGSTESPSLLGR